MEDKSVVDPDPVGTFWLNQFMIRNKCIRSPGQNADPNLAFQAGNFNDFFQFFFTMVQSRNDLKICMRTWGRIQTKSFRIYSTAFEQVFVFINIEENCYLRCYRHDMI